MGKAGLLGFHTIIVVDKDGNVVWPQEEGERRLKPLPRWGVENRAEPLPTPMFNFKEYELRLLAAYAQCCRGQLTLKQLPLIPVDMADLIIRRGGLTEWINCEEKRLQRFWKMVRDQAQPKAKIGSRKNKRSSTR